MAEKLIRFGKAGIDRGVSDLGSHLRKIANAVLTEDEAAGTDAAVLGTDDLEFRPPAIVKNNHETAACTLNVVAEGDADAMAQSVNLLPGEAVPARVKKILAAGTDADADLIFTV